ncbi:MAG: NAD(P)H-dependent oxidoreductase [Pseudomonadota bacterium]
MSTLLILDTSPSKASVSRQLTETFVREWAKANPNGTVLRRDVGMNPPAHLDEKLLEALRSNPELLSDHHKKAHHDSDSAIEELNQADMIVIGAPMHNFSISSGFKAWIDHVAIAGKTFGFSEKGPEGLLKDRPVYVISARGGDYGDGAETNPHPADFQTGYVRHIFAFMGIQSINIIAANGMDMGDEPRAAGIDEAEQKILALFAA